MGGQCVCVEGVGMIGVGCQRDWLGGGCKGQLVVPPAMESPDLPIDKNGAISEVKLGHRLVGRA